MNYLTLENVSRSYGEKVLFNAIDLQISKGQKVALIAKNGSGKTTLLKVIAGIEPSDGDTSKVMLRSDVRVGYLPQEPEFFRKHNVLEAIFDSDNALMVAIKQYERALLKPQDDKSMQQALQEMEDLKAWNVEAKVKEILFKLNITDLEQEVSTLSGGQKKRLALAKLLIEEPEFLILDEPTNHLDLDMIEWLESFLSQPNLTLFMVTHDRYYMEHLCDTMLELDGGQLFKYSGGYSDFLEKKALRSETESIELDKTRKLYRKELDWMRRSPKARTTKANARTDRFYEIEEQASKRFEKDEIQIDIKGQRLGGKIVELHYIHKAFGDIQIARDFHYKFKKGEKVGIVGKNGTGKTTLLRMMAGEEKPDKGKVIIGETVVVGYYTQEGISTERSDKRVIDFITDIAEYIPLERGQKLGAAQLLERFLFNRAQQQVYVSQLSGGERRRLLLLSVLMKNPNFLILDEPTNDLDVVTLNILEEWLLEFPGCVVIVSHDRFLLDKICDHLFILEGNGRIKDFNGRYLDYREKQIEIEREQKRYEREIAEQPKILQVRTASGLTAPEKNEMKKLEREINELETRKKQIHDNFSAEDISLDTIQKLTAELRSLEESLASKELRWMELAEK